MEAEVEPVCGVALLVEKGAEVGEGVVSVGDELGPADFSLHFFLCHFTHDAVQQLFVAVDGLPDLLALHRHLFLLLFQLAPDPLVLFWLASLCALGVLLLLADAADVFFLRDGFG